MNDWPITAGGWADSFVHSFIQRIFTDSLTCAEATGVNKTNKWSLPSWLMFSVRAALGSPHMLSRPGSLHLCSGELSLVLYVLTGTEAWGRRLPKAQLPIVAQDFSSRERAPQG